MPFDLFEFQADDFRDEIEWVLTPNGVEVYGLARLCHNIHLDHRTQIVKLSPRGIIFKLVIPDSRGRGREHWVIPKEKVAKWLSDIDPSKVSDRARPKLEQYQRHVEALLNHDDYGRGDMSTFTSPEFPAVQSQPQPPAKIRPGMPTEEAIQLSRLVTLNLEKQQALEQVVEYQGGEIVMLHGTQQQQAEIIHCQADQIRRVETENVKLKAELGAVNNKTDHAIKLAEQTRERKGDEFFPVTAYAGRHKIKFSAARGPGSPSYEGWVCKELSKAMVHEVHEENYEWKDEDGLTHKGIHGMYHKDVLKEWERLRVEPGRLVRRSAYRGQAGCY